MNEQDALAVTAVRAVEVIDRERTLWSDADRAWASRAAAEVVGEGATADVFVARRAALAFERLGQRYPPLRRAVAALRWRSWIGVALIVLAFIVGVAIDRIGEARQINLLAPPVLGLLAWNVGVYLWLLMAALFAPRSDGGVNRHPWRAALTRLAGGVERWPRREAQGSLANVVTRLVTDWSGRAAPIYQARAARILHWAAAFLACGVLAGLYLRGVAYEYRVTWESTFLDAATVRDILSITLAPGGFVTRLPLPTREALEAMRSGAAPASANAANWLHLMAATIAVVVVVPRLVLGFANGLVERYRRTRIAVALDEPYHQRIMRGFSGGPVRIDVLPYSYQPSSVAANGLQQIVHRVFGGSASLVVSAPIAYGQEETLAMPATPSAATIALFNATATPERETHGVFLTRLRARADNTLVVLVDESTFPANADARLGQRRQLWQTLGRDHGAEPVFVNLSAPDVAAIESAIEAQLHTQAE
ncbi:MAG TPA: DUF2868 domain-containing protein [Casimicrobiaceae bacterium]|nr:DUF2868 domain-containing protein [Casimicrobiaceae bacterium]